MHRVMPVMCCLEDIARRPIYHAILSAYLSIIIGLIETALAIYTGHAHISMALYGIALMAFVDVVGSVLIVYTYYGLSDTTHEMSGIDSDRKAKELKYSYVIGVLMMILGVFFIYECVIDLIEGQSPNNDDGVEGELGLLTSVYGALGSFFLAAYKYRVAKDLDSSVILADSISSLCSGLASFASVVVAVDVYQIWWLDGVTGFLVAFYTLYSGSQTITSSSRALAEMRLRDGTDDALLQKYRFSYQNDYTAEDERASKAAVRQAVDGPLTRPTPYNFDYEDRSSMGYFEALLSQTPLRMLGNSLDSNIPGVVLLSSNSYGSQAGSEYDSIPNFDSEEEVTFEA